MRRGPISRESPYGIRRRRALAASAVFALAALAGCRVPRSFPLPPPIQNPAWQEGVASWYGPGFHGKATASGEVFDQDALTAAHRTLPLGTQVRVTNLRNGRSTIVRINDRGPFAKDRVIDLSRRAAVDLGVVGPGTAPVRIEAADTRALLPPEIEWAVQLASFTEHERARSLQTRLAPALGRVYLRRARAGRQIVWRVRVGPYPTEQAAHAAREKIRRSLRDARVVEEDGVGLIEAATRGPIRRD